MAGRKKNYQRVVINLPPKTAATLEYLIKIAQVARTKSDLVVQMLNEYIDKRRDTLNDSKSWRAMIESFDTIKKDKVENILEKYLPDYESDDIEEEDE
ncbi:MAG: hypothetical protein GF364_05160 [Candidatus Lokiarchaeota archaeon]|nr:hypothetical protein [Candidatus Lokiarchaeota archaeon]